MEKIKYSVALILFASSILSQNQSLENPAQIAISNADPISLNRARNDGKWQAIGIKSM